MKRYKIKLKGNTPLMHHRLDVNQLIGPCGPKPRGKKGEKEKLVPREVAERHVYRDNDGCCVIPTSYIMGAFKGAASDYKQQNSIRKSLKSIAAGIFCPDNEYEKLLDNKGKVLKNFEVDVRPAVNHQKGAIVVCRPRFDEWNVEMTVSIDDELISQETTLHILNDAGRRCGIGSYRVSKGGPFGKFQVVEFIEV